MLYELRPVRAEAVRLDDLRARLRVRAMDFLHEVGRPEIQLVVTLIDEDAPTVQHRTHRTVEHHDARRVEQSLERRAAHATASAATGLAERTA